MKLNEICELHNLPSKVALEYFKTRHPHLKLTANSELPKEFEYIVEELSKEPSNSSDLTLSERQKDGLKNAESNTIDEETNNNHKSVKTAYYQILEQSNQTRQQDLALDCRISAVEDIQAFKASYNSVWSLYHQNEIALQLQRNQSLNDRLDGIAERKENQDKQLGKHNAIQDCTDNGKKQISDRIDSLLY